MNAMDSGEWSIKEAAKLLGVSPKTVRRHIVDGRIKAEKRPGKWGEEYRVTAIPRGLRKEQSEKDKAGETPGDIVREKDRQIAELNQMLGAARLRISQLESEVKLLEAPKDKRPWWRRLFGR